MLTGPLVRVRYARDRIVPYFIDATNEEWLLIAEQLRDLFLAHRGRTRGELETAIDELFGDDNDTLVQRGLAKLLEDRCGFTTAPGLPPEQLRQEVFKAAVEFRLAPPVILGDSVGNVQRRANPAFADSASDADRGTWPHLALERKASRRRLIATKYCAASRASVMV
jgi:predicted nuclease of restriction endonuclease-like RecB superfamily